MAVTIDALELKITHESDSAVKALDTLIETLNKLKDAAGISAASIAKLGKGGNITTDVLLKICETLDCKVEDIIETIVDKKGNGDDESSKEKQRL